jgi:hypothetical protein
MNTQDLGSTLCGDKIIMSNCVIRVTRHWAVMYGDCCMVTIEGETEDGIPVIYRGYSSEQVERVS